MENSKIVNRTPLEGGNFSTINNKALNDINLSDSAIRMLICILNNSEDWILNIHYIGRKIGWSKDKTTTALKCLIDNNYIFKKKINCGNSFKYEYTINENPEINQINDSLKVGLVKNDNLKENDIKTSKLDNLTIPAFTTVVKSGLNNTNLDKNKNIKLNSNIDIRKSENLPTQNTEPVANSQKAQVDNNPEKEIKFIRKDNFQSKEDKIRKEKLFYEIKSELEKYGLKVEKNLKMSLVNLIEVEHRIGIYDLINKKINPSMVQQKEFVFQLNFEIERLKNTNKVLH